MLIEKSLKAQEFIGKGCHNNSLLIDKNMKLQNQITKNHDLRSKNQVQGLERLESFMKQMQAQMTQM